MDWVKAYFEPHKRECLGCTSWDKGECQIIQGLEHPVYCPALQDHLQYEEARLYGADGEALRKARG